MINKLSLQSAISKYYLGGLIESVKWRINEDILFIDFVSPNKNLVGKISLNGFKLDKSEIGIYNTSRLVKLISILDKEIILSLIKERATYIKLKISDQKFNLIYALSDTLLIPNVPKITEPQYDIETSLQSEEILSLIKAQSASSSEELLINIDVTSDGVKRLEFIFGDVNEYSNKISYFSEKIETQLETLKLPFNSELIKEILSSNKESTDSKLYIDVNGLIKLEFISKEITSTYFLVREEDK